MIDLLSTLLRRLVVSVARALQALENPAEHRIQVVLLALMTTLVFAIIIVTVILIVPRRRRTLRRLGSLEVAIVDVSDVDAEEPDIGVMDTDSDTRPTNDSGLRPATKRSSWFSGLFVVALVVAAVTGGWYMTDQQWYCANMCHSVL